MARHLLRVAWDERRLGPPPGPDAGWPYDVPAVAQLLRDGWEPADGATVLVGENGSGKSTLVEAVAAAYPRWGASSPDSALIGTRPSPEDSPLARGLRCEVDRMASPGGFFLRAELMHAFLGRVDPQFFGGRPLNERSHGESFLAFLDRAAETPGLYLLDEPESALSFSSCLALLGLLGDLVAGGAQVVLATHSPVLAALPGAQLLEVGDWGVRGTTWEELQLVRDWRSFLGGPERWLRHLA